MDQDILSVNYPFEFSKENVRNLAEQINARNSVVLLGIKRVGIGNFLRFFLGQPDAAREFIANFDNHVFIQVDLNDLFECEIGPFWILTLKRIVDSLENIKLSEKTKTEIKDLFLESIQLKDTFFTIDSVRLALGKIIGEGFLPTLFFVRFDRLGNSVNQELFANLEGLKNFSAHKLGFVFTSFVPFKRVFSAVSAEATLSLGIKYLFIRPTFRSDSRIILDAYKQRHNLNLPPELEEEVLRLTAGHFQYLQLCLIALQEPAKELKTNDDLFEYLINDERIRLQSEELWENLDQDEQAVVTKIVKGEKITDEEKEKTANLFDTELIKTENNNNAVFCPLFNFFVDKRVSEEAKDSAPEFSKKELMLFDFLKNNVDQICEREKIIEAVWPEGTGLGISDWAIDKLVERVRNKLKNQDNNFEIQTIKTRGFKLVELK